MAPLTSISETRPTCAPPPKPNSDASQPPRKRTLAAAEFARSRPRSRVVVISKLPSRVRKRSQSTNTSKQRGQKALGTREASAQASKSQQPPNANNERSFQKENAFVSPSSVYTAPAHSPKAPSEATVDLDSFPLPPTFKKAWPLPDHPQERLALPPLRPDAGTSKKQPKQPPKRSPRHPYHSLAVPAFSDPNAPACGTRHRVLRNRDYSRARQEKLADSVLVDAISKSVAERIRQLSLSEPLDAASQSRAYCDDQGHSRTASQKKALERFTKELHRHAHNVSAFGKVPAFSSTPTKSPHTLRTVSALLPFRPEFRAAGLAVTSRDQAGGQPGHSQWPHANQAPTQPAADADFCNSSVPQVDGKLDSLMYASDEVSFTRPNDVDNWRYALIDKLPEPRSSHGCLPCFTLPSYATIREGLCGKGYAEGHGKDPRSNLKYTNHSKRHNMTRPTQVDSTTKLRSKPSKHPRDPWAPVSNTLPQTTAKSGKPGPTGFPPNRATGMRQRSATWQANIGRTKGHEGIPREHVAMRQRAATQTLPLDCIPQEPTEINLWRSADQHQGIPPTQHGKPPAEGDDDFEGAGLPARVNNEAKEATAKKRAQAADKASMVAREIASHDLGRYPSRQAEPRRISGRSHLELKIPGRTSSVRRDWPSTFKRTERSGDKIKDRDVLRGLHIAAAAACSEELDELVHSQTGVRIRRFLSDLMALEALSYSDIDESPEARVQRRRAQMRKLKKQFRMSRELQRMPV